MLTKITVEAALNAALEDLGYVPDTSHWANSPVFFCSFFPPHLADCRLDFGSQPRLLMW